jgi:hypothetical protein
LFVTDELAVMVFACAKAANEGLTADEKKAARAIMKEIIDARR